MAKSEAGWALAGVRGAARALLRIPRRRAIVPVALWMALIWVLSSFALPGTGDPSAAKAFLADLAHAPVFGMLGLWLVLLAPRRPDWAELSARTVAAILGVVLAYALLDEAHQAAVPRRDASVFDVVTDLVGAACVLWIADYSGSSGATHRGLVARFAIGLLMCALAALGSTAWAVTRGPGLWL